MDKDITDMKGFIYITLLATSIYANPILAEHRVFGIVAKSVIDNNFIEVWKACNSEAEKYEDSCKLIGSQSTAHVRTQLESLSSSLNSQTLDAIAISVMKSDLTADLLKDVEIPIITFDSPFEVKHKAISQSYIGVDNVAFGKSLAEIALNLLPIGGSVCFMTDLHDSNLSLRVNGARKAFSQQETWGEQQRLKGENGWTEPSRCPLNTSDNIDRSIQELEISLSQIKPDVLISVGQWPILDTERYESTILTYQDNNPSNRTLIVVGAGSLFPEEAALLDKNLVTGIVSIDFQSMGRLVYQTLRSIVNNEAFLTYIEVPQTILISK